MPRQLIFTSVPAGLSPGRSGYCTVAKSAGIGERIAREIERLSAHEPGEGECFTFNILRVAGETLALLTRYDDAGADYSGRASTIAHHLVFDTAEMAGLPPPADLARRFAGWCQRWQGQPRLLSDDPTLVFPGKPAALPAETWKRFAGDAGKAALFCDDAGRPKPGRLPAPGGAETLALLAEASLLLEDKGWTNPFTTRIREPDTWASWRSSPGVIAATLPEPGTGRRATLARSGVMAGARPVPGATPKKFQGRPHGAIFEAPPTKAGLPMPVIALSAAVTLGAVGLIAYLLVGKKSSVVPAETAPEVPAKTSPGKAPHPLVKTAFEALDRGDIVAAAQAWIALSTASPKDADANRSLILAPVRDRLADSVLAPIRKKYDAARLPIPADEAKPMLDAMALLKDLAKKTGVSLTSGAGDTMDMIEKGLAVMRRTDEAIPECTLVHPVWTEVSRTEIAVSKTTGLGDAGALTEFLSEKHDGLRVVIAKFRGFGGTPEPALEIPVTEKNYSPGRVLSVVHPEYNELLRFSIDERRRPSLLRRSILSAPGKTGILNSDTDSLFIDIADTASGRHQTLVLTGATAADRPFPLPGELLTASGGTVSPPPWLAGVAARIRCDGHPALIPTQYNGTARDLPGLACDRSVIEQSLNTRIAAAKHPPGAKRAVSAAVKKETARLAALRAGLPGNAVEAGAPWGIVVCPPGASDFVPLFRFDP